MADATYQPKVYRDSGGNRQVIAPGGELLIEGIVRGLVHGSDYFVDGDDGNDTNDGLSWAKAFATIGQGISTAIAGDRIFIKPKIIAVGGLDPVSYAETLIIPATKPGLQLIGIQNGLAQGAQPQIKKGSGSTAQLTIRAPGCLIRGLTINGIGATGGGILLDDDAVTKTAFGTIIEDCFLKNCQGTGAAATGGAIQIGATGGAWQLRISRCRFFKNLAGIMSLAAAVVQPKDIVIEDCEFGSDVNTEIDADIYFKGVGVTGLLVNRCNFATVDVPAYASSPSAARYLDLTNCVAGLLANCMFACTGKTFTSSGDAAKIPATVRKSGCYQENALIVA